MSRYCVSCVGVVLVAAVLAVPVATRAADAPIPGAVTAAVKDPGRLPYDVVRDALRKPAEAVAFSMIKPGDTIVDLVPADGYYTRILSKLVRPNGKVYMMVPLQAGAPGQERLEQALLRKQGKDWSRPIDAALAIQNISAYNNTEVLWESLTVYGGQFSVPVQVDAVWIAGNYHNLHNDSFVGPNLDFTPKDPARAPKHLDVATFDKVMFASMNPGAYLTIIDNAAAPGAGFSQTEILGRAEAAAVKAEVMGAGFVLDGESDALTNPADDHTKRASDATLGGKPDEFMLRFRKPMDAINETKRPPADAMDGYYGNTARSGGGTEDITRRWVSYHPDGSYHEFGVSGAAVQSGTWYWDAAGHNCMIHQYPIAERQGIVCHVTKTYVKVGDKWTENSATGIDRPMTILPGYQQPDPSEVTDEATSR